MADGFAGYPVLKEPLQICPYAEIFTELHRNYVCAVPEANPMVMTLALLVALWFLSRREKE